MWTCIYAAIFINLLRTCAPHRDSKIREFTIGGIFDDATEDQELAFRIAVDLANGIRMDSPPFRLAFVSGKVDTRNVLKTSWETCRLMAEGLLGIVGPNSVHSSPYVQSICDSMEMPQIETHWYYRYQRRNASINVHPHPPVVQEIYADLISAWGWQKFTMLYEDDDSLQKIGKLLTYSKELVLTMRQIVFDASGSCRNMLNAIKKSGENHFVVISSIGVLQELLKQAQQVGLVTEKQHYFVYNLDIHTANLEPYQYGGCNITGIRFVNPDDPDFVRAAGLLHDAKTNKSETTTLTTETALIADAVRLFYNILEDLHASQHPPEVPLHCGSSTVRLHGFSIINDMMIKNVSGITGLLKFDPEGFRTEVKADVVELGVTGLRPVGTWSTGEGLRINRTYGEEGSEGDGSFRHRSFVVIIALTNPYAMVKETTHRLYGNDRFEGYGIDLIHELSLALGFNYTFIVQEDGSNGNYNRQTRKWDGMIGEIVAKRAHLAITDLTITAERERAVDFTLPFMNLGISILYKKPEPVPPSLFMFLSPFSWKVWMLLLAAYFVVSVSLFVMARICPSEWTHPYPCIEEPEYLINQFSLRNSLWFTIGSLMQQGTEIAPTGVSTRMVAGVWWFFTLIMVSSYTANLAAFLTVETLVTPFKGIEDLARQTEISYGAKADGATAYFFRDSDKETYKKIWRYMYKHPEMMTGDNDEGVRRVGNGNYAFLMESTTIEYVTERKCKLAQVGDLLVEKGYGIAMEKGSKYRSALNAAILKLQETGQLTNLKIKWWKEKRDAGNCEARSAGATVKSLNLQNVGGVFLVLGVGSLFGVLLTFVELSVHTMRRSYRQNVDFRKEMKDEMKFFVRFSGMVKPQK